MKGHVGYAIAMIFTLGLTGASLWNHELMVGILSWALSIAFFRLGQVTEKLEYFEQKDTPK